MRDDIASRHKRFIGATIYCPAKPGREKLPDDHEYGDGYVCPFCEAIVPPARGLVVSWESREATRRSSHRGRWHGPDPDRPAGGMTWQIVTCPECGASCSCEGCVADAEDGPSHLPKEGDR